MPGTEHRMSRAGRGVQNVWYRVQGAGHMTHQNRLLMPTSARPFFSRIQDFSIGRSPLVAGSWAEPDPFAHAIRTPINPYTLSIRTPINPNTHAIRTHAIRKHGGSGGAPNVPEGSLPRTPAPRRQIAIYLRVSTCKFAGAELHNWLIIKAKRLGTGRTGKFGCRKGLGRTGHRRSTRAEKLIAFFGNNGITVTRNVNHE